jgi:hypothetical protein
MAEQRQWPSLPETAYPEHQKEYAKSLFDARLEVAKTQQVGIDSIEKAKQQAEVDIAKARQQAEVDISKAKQQANVDLDKAKRQADIDEEKARVTTNTEHEKADWSNEYVQAQAFYTAYIEVAKGQVERAIGRAEFVSKAAGAIGGVYTAILAFSFALEVNPLPARGIIPTVFLGLAIVLATGYLAYVSGPDTVAEAASSGTLDSRQRERRNAFIRWAGAPAVPRSYLLQASIFGLAFGVAFLPAPYVKVDNLMIGTLAGGTLIWVLALIAVLLTFVLPALGKVILGLVGRPGQET